ncbi:unnamed protein product [Dovyalis caffra]|uniref:DUF7036 domain-containing protein n=1 Tax=Dovyalis caffra TaxID=77055 RepID=A0AAV1SX14_9ROSI|nr:unnamed protein product [Dovyalis caffra]
MLVPIADYIEKAWAYVCFGNWAVIWEQNVYVKITNENGSTITPPVTLQASIVSDLGTLQLQRLKQLAQIITVSPVKILGLNN